MKIKKFRLQRFRSLRDVTIEGLGPLTILMGASGSGKTSVIEALQMFTQNFDGQLEKPLSGFDKRLWFRGEDRQPIEIELSLEIDRVDIESLSEDTTTKLGLKSGKNTLNLRATIEMKNGTVTWKNTPLIDEKEVKKQTPQKKDASPPETEETLAAEISPASEEGTNTETTKPEISSGNLSDFFEIISNKFYWLKGSRLQGTSIGPAGIDSRNPYIPESIQEELKKRNDTDLQYDNALIANVFSAFKKILPESEFGFDGNGIYVYEGEFRNRLNLMGAGQQTFLYLIYEIFDHSNQIMVLEDPESFLHPSLCKILFEFLRDYKGQMIIVSHSPLFIEKQVINSNWKLFTKDGETHVKRAKTTRDLANILTDLGSEPKDSLLPNRVLIVEGLTEKEAVPIWLEKLGGKPHLPEFRIVNIEGSGDRQTAKTWVKLAKDTQIKVFLLADYGADKLIETVQTAGLSELDIHVLKRDIEDTYPITYVNKALKEIYGINVGRGTPKIENIDESLSRAKEIRRVYKDGLKVNATEWKVPLGRAVAELMDPDEIEEELRKFLKRVIGVN